jgi:putative ABC transport system permease protein
VFIPAPTLPATGLLQRGSRVNYAYYYRFAPGVDVDKYAASLGSRLDKEGIRSDTVAERKNNTGRAFTDMTKFLNLVAFVALLLGCVGVASAVHLYVKEKIASVAVLRCLGTTGRQAFYIFLIQTALMGLAGAVAGAALGSAIQFALPGLFGAFLPVDVSLQLSPTAIAQGIGTGLGIAVLFALLPLLVIRRISPLRTLRTSYEDDVTGRDPLQWLVYGLVVLFIGGFSYWQTRDWNWRRALRRPAGGLRHTHRPGLPAHVPRAEVLPGVVELRVAAEPG